MIKTTKEVLSDVLSRRRDFVKLIIAAIFLAVGTALIANYISSLFEPKSNYLLLIGLIPVLLIIIYLGYAVVKHCRKSLKINAVLVFDRKTLDHIRVGRYSFSEEINQVLNSVFLENNALKKHWYSELKEEDEKEEIEKTNEIEQEVQSDVKKEEKKRKVSYVVVSKHEYTPQIQDKITDSNKVLNECIEHSIIEKISTHLSTYFNEYDNEDKYVKEYTRTDLPKILLENRVTNLLSTPFEDRDIFTKFDIKKEDDGEIVSIYGSDGSHFTKFDLTLPTGTNVTREKSGKLKFENKRVVLDISIKNEGFSRALPTGFEYNYLGIKGKHTIIVKQIDIEIKTYIKPWS